MKTRQRALADSSGSAACHTAMVISNRGHGVFGGWYEAAGGGSLCATSMAREYLHPMAAKPSIYTIGHSTHALPEFIALLQSADVAFLVDVRTIPRSRTNPQFNYDTLPASLQKADIGYRHVAALGGLRSRQKTHADSPNSFWTNTSFRNYADYALGESFRKGLAELESLAATHTCAIMCAEAVWWRCHRRIIADYLLSDGYPVFHIMGPGKIDAARMTEGAEPVGAREILYRG